PTVSATPDFIYRYDMKTGVPERMSRSFGSTIVDPADTVGDGATEVGLSLLYSDFTRRDGKSLPGTSPVFVFPRDIDQNGRPITSRARLRFTQFDLDATVLSWTLTHGLTEHWDVGLATPLVRTSLLVRGQTTARVAEFRVPLEKVRIDDAKYGFGDVLIKTKYRVDAIGGVEVTP